MARQDSDRYIASSKWLEKIWKIFMLWSCLTRQYLAVKGHTIRSGLIVESQAL